MDMEQHIVDLFARGDSRAMDVLYSAFADYLASVGIRYVPHRKTSTTFFRRHSSKSLLLSARFAIVAKAR